jgi:signal transduction histidine kinase
VNPTEKVPRAELGHLLALLVHDLRSPLAAAITNASVVQEEPGLTEDAREAMADLELALSETQRGLEQAMWIAHAFDGTGPQDTSRGELGPVLRAAVAASGVEVSSKVDAGLMVRGTSLVGRIVQGLLVNARDHGRHGAVQLIAERRDDEIVIEVHDEGPALAPELRARAFSLEAQSALKARAGGRYGRYAALFACDVAATAIGGRLTHGGRDGAAFFRLSLPRA